MRKLNICAFAPDFFYLVFDLENFKAKTFPKANFEMKNVNISQNHYEEPFIDFDFNFIIKEKPTK